jgi:hypothetical protein
MLSHAKFLKCQVHTHDHEALQLLQSLRSYCSKSVEIPISGGVKGGRYKVKIKKYSCPLCHQGSSRKWNTIIHIARKHPGSNVEPVLTSLRKANSSSGGNVRDESIYRTSFGRGPKAGEGNNALDTMNETMGKIIKFKRQLDELVAESRSFNPFNCIVPPSSLQPFE